VCVCVCVCVCVFVCVCERLKNVLRKQARRGGCGVQEAGEPRQREVREVPPTWFGGGEQSG
jgi:hypothetical protein